MKTAVSIPDEVFASADSLAKRLGVSRSELYACALSEFVAKHQAARVTERLNAVYGVQSGRVDPDVRRHQRRVAGQKEW